MTKSLIKTLMIFSVAVFLCLFIVGIVQGFVLGNLQAEKQQLQTQNNQWEADIKKLDDEIEYKSSDDYLKDYLELEGYGGENDKILKP